MDISGAFAPASVHEISRFAILSFQKKTTTILTHYDFDPGWKSLPSDYRRDAPTRLSAKGLCRSAVMVVVAVLELRNSLKSPKRGAMSR